MRSRTTSAVGLEEHGIVEAGGYGGDCRVEALEVADGYDTVEVGG